MNRIYIWSLGPFENEYSRQSKLVLSSTDQILNQIHIANKTGILWLRNGDDARGNDLIKFYHLFNHLKRAVILVTTDGVRPTPSSYPKKLVYRFLNSNKIVKWLTQNYDGSIIHSKLQPMPIGFDLHNPKTYWDGCRGYDKLEKMIEIRKQSESCERINKIYCDGHVPSEWKSLRYTHQERAYLHQLLLANSTNYIVLQDGRKSFKDVTLQYNKYKFALSPRGKGLDCHRTWELFLAGAIVITRTSSLDAMYINSNLPVVILKNWEELFKPKLEVRMQEWANKYSKWTSLDHILPRLRFNSWIKYP